jgi:cysteine desulfurase
VTARGIYLDWNATTPIHPDVAEAMREAATDGWANPASVHGPGRRARALVEAARDAVAKLVGFDARDVMFTSGGTEANNLALAHPFADGAGALVVSAIEHPSVLRAAESLAERGVEVIRIEPNPSGLIEVDALMRAVDAHRGVRLVALQAVNHETGVIQPVAEVAARLVGRGIRLHVDAVQAIGRLEPSTWAGADLVALAGHKIRGPKGIGALVTRPGITIRPVLVGGAQERGLRPGTQDAIACAGLGAAASRAAGGPARYAALAEVRDRLEAGLTELATSERNGTGPRAPHVTNISFAGWRGDELCAALDLEGVAASSGAACSAGTAEPSAVIRAMVGEARAASAVRFSLGEDTSAKDVAEVLIRAKRVLARG